MKRAASGRFSLAWQPLGIGVLLLMAVTIAGGCAKGKLADQFQQMVTAPVSRLASALENEKNFATLVNNYSQGVVRPQPWVGFWWPYVAAGIASNWRDEKGLGPADKYDAAYQNYLKENGLDASRVESAAAWERSRHGPGLGSIASWWGHCNGWAASSVLVPEPREARTINGVTFEVRDLKALLTESWMEFSGDFIGTRMDDPKDFKSAAFWDVVPAQFFLLLTNVVGKEGRGLILDRYTGAEIWNQPLVAFKIDPVRREDYLGPHPSFPSVHRVNLTTTIWWANDNVQADDITPRFDFENPDEYFFPGRKLRYELWLDGPVEFDAEGRITSSGDILVAGEANRYVGGAWKNGSDSTFLIHSHPDYLWMPYGLQASSGYKNPRIDDNWVRNFIGKQEAGY